MNTNEQKLFCLDGIKGIGACVIAFIWHYQHFSPQNGSPFYNVFPGFYQYGWLMVEIFFMLSGFGMAMGYENKIVKEQISFSTFMTKRIKRLFPLMAVTLILTACFQAIYLFMTNELFVYQNFDIYHFFLNLYGIQTVFLETEYSFNGPAWCISVTMFLYVIFYIVTWVGKKYYKNLPYVYAGIALAGCCFLRWNLNYPLVNTAMFRGISCFFIGTALYHIYSKIRGRKLLGYIALFVVCVCYLFARIFGYQTWGDVQMLVIIAIGPLSILSVLLLPWLEKIFSVKCMQWLGKRSFGIYLCHFPTQLLIKLIDAGGLGINYSRRITWILYVVMTMVVVMVVEKIVLPLILNSCKIEKV